MNRAHPLRAARPAQGARLLLLAGALACMAATATAGDGRHATSAVVSTPRDAPSAVLPDRPVPVPVLIYHQIVEAPTAARPPGETVITLARFAEQMDYLAEHGYTTIGMDELVRYMRSGGPLPPRPVAITFDDGWKSALRAVAVLDRHRFKASFWIIAGPRGIGGAYMDWADIERLARNPRYEIGSHTVSHPWGAAENLVTWARRDVDGAWQARVRSELEQSRRTLEQRLGRSVRRLAWPRGWYDQTLVTMAQQAGYDALLTTDDGLNRPGDDVLRIRRSFVYGECDLAAFARLLHDGDDRICAAARRVSVGHLPPAVRPAAAPVSVAARQVR